MHTVHYTYVLMRDLRFHLRAAILRKGYTGQRLLDESGLGCDLSSLNRKLNGFQGLEASEARELARVLGVRHGTVCRAASLAESLGGTVSWPAERRRAS